MKKIICSLIFCSQFHLMVLAQPSLEKKHLFGNRVEILVPLNLKDSVDPNLIALYPQIAASYNFSDASKMIYLMSAVKDIAIDDNGIPAHTNMLLSQLRRQKNIKILEDGIFLQDGKNIGFVKFGTSRAKLGFHYLFYTSFKNKLLLFQFSCPQKYRATWEPTINEIANSLRIKEV